MKTKDDLTLNFRKSISRNLKNLLAIVPAVVILIWIYGGISALYSSAYDYFVPPKSMVSESLEASLVTVGSQLPPNARLDWAEATQSLNIQAVELLLSSSLTERASMSSKDKKAILADCAGRPTCLCLKFAIHPRLVDREFVWKGRVFPKADILLELWTKKQGRYAHHWTHYVDWKGVELMPMNAQAGVSTALVY